MSTPYKSAGGSATVGHVGEAVQEAIATVPLAEACQASQQLTAGQEVFLAATVDTSNIHAHNAQAALAEAGARLDRAGAHLIAAVGSLGRYLSGIGVGGNINGAAQTGASEQQAARDPGDRRVYMRNAGFLLFTDVGHGVAETALNDITPKRVDPAEISHMLWHEADNPSGANLGVVTNSLANQLEDLTDDREALHALHGVTAEDLAAQEGLAIHQNGFADMDFTWRSSAAVLNHLLAEYEARGDITPEERANMTLSDCAEMIESDWFVALMEDLALTSNGEYGTFGRFSREYCYETVKKMPPFKEADQSFTFETDGKRLVSARISDQLRQRLRAVKGDSPGCPVARHNGTLPTEVIAANPHAQHLIATGRIKITEVIGDRTRFTQEQTPIGANLKILAKHLRDYESRFGAPNFY